MAGVKGKSGGARSGAGRPLEKFTARKDEFFIMERESIGESIHPPELWRVLSISENEIEFQHGNDIVVIRRPGDDD